MTQTLPDAGSVEFNWRPDTKGIGMPEVPVPADEAALEGPANAGDEDARLLAVAVARFEREFEAKDIAAERYAAKRKATATADTERKAAVEAMRGKLLDREALRALQPAPYLIKGVLDTDSESWLIGASGGFKSFMAVDWACHVALGEMWWGRRIKKGRVLYVVGEGVGGINKRVAAWELAHKQTVTGVQVHPGPIQVRATGERDSISFDWGTLCQLAAEEGFTLIILDTQARMTVGLEENSNTSMGVWIEGVRMLREATGACVLVVHHTGRNGGDARGASALDGAQDAEWKVSRVGDKSKRCAELTCEKSKDGDDDQKFEFQAHVVELGMDEDGDPITSLSLRPMSADMAKHVREDGAGDPEDFEYDHEARLTDNQAEVYAVLHDVVTERGDAIGTILRLVNERRRERASKTGIELRAMPRTSLTRALESLEKAGKAVALGKTGGRFVDADKWSGEVEEESSVAA